MASFPVDSQSSPRFSRLHAQQAEPRRGQTQSVDRLGFIGLCPMAGLGKDEFSTQRFPSTDEWLPNPVPPWIPSWLQTEVSQALLLTLPGYFEPDATRKKSPRRPRGFSGGLQHGAAEGFASAPGSPARRRGHHSRGWGAGGLAGWRAGGLGGSGRGGLNYERDISKGGFSSRNAGWDFTRVTRFSPRKDCRLVEGGTSSAAWGWFANAGNGDAASDKCAWASKTKTF